VFQRTPAYVVPARNAPLDSREREAVKANYPALRALAKAHRNGLLWETSTASALDVSEQERERAYRERWERGGLCFAGAFKDLLSDARANETAAEFVRARIREAVHDPAVAERLSPRTVVGCKRLCVDTGYYEAFNRPNVALVDVSDQPIEEIVPDGLLAGGRRYPLDAIVFATGFDAMTGALTRIDIRGSGGVSLRERWAEGPGNYLGLTIAGFPNLFMVAGPGSPSVLTNMVQAIEQHVDWIAGCLDYLRAHRLSCIDATADAQEAWVARVNEIADGTLFPACNSWYLGANVPGKSRMFMPFVGFPPYVATCNDVAADGYRGFTLS
jgi:cyclohexanone monooxygenase